MPRLGVTRSKEQLTSLVALAALKNLEIIPLPLTIIEPLPFELPHGILPENIHWLLFTSANGVGSFFMHCRNKNWSLSKNIKIAAIGKKTKETLEAIGHHVDFVPSQAYGEQFFPEFIKQMDINDKNILYPRAEIIVNDPTEQFHQVDASFYSVICYRTSENNCSKELVEKLSNDDYIFFTAPSSVYAYQHQFGQPAAKVLAIGSTTAAAIEKINWQVYRTLETPEIEKVLEYI